MKAYPLGIVLAPSVDGAGGSKPTALSTDGTLRCQKIYCVEPVGSTAAINLYFGTPTMNKSTGAGVIRDFKAATREEKEFEPGEHCDVLYPAEYAVDSDEDLAATKSITGAVSNGVPNLIRVTATAHGYSTGNIVRNASVGGTTEANGLWVVTVIDANTFDLQGSTFTNAYTSGGTAAKLTQHGLLVTYFVG